MPHVIRLRGPWREETAPDGRGARRQFRRTFHWPRTAKRGGESLPIDLVIEGAAAKTTIILNNQLLGRTAASQTAPALRLPVTALLRPDNELILEMPLDESTRQSAIGEVRLEIHDDAEY